MTSAEAVETTVTANTTNSLSQDVSSLDNQLSLTPTDYLIGTSDSLYYSLRGNYNELCLPKPNTNALKNLLSSKVS